MFFTMLKNDLKTHKGLNIILFIFILCASVISVMAANLMYMEIVGKNSTDQISNISNAVINCNVGMGDFEEKKQSLLEWMQENSVVDDVEMKEYVRLFDSEVQLGDTYASEDSFPSHSVFHITVMSKRINLFYNVDNEPFSVDTCKVAISLDLADMAGLSIGDEIRITTQMGNIYSFTVSEIYKKPAKMNSEDLIISDADYEKLKEENPLRLINFLVKTDSMNDLRRITTTLREEGLVKACSGYYYTPEIDMDYTVLVVISCFLLAISIIIMIIMFITIRFMMVAAIKQEEKEIGMMRAIGVDSFKYRWMFAAVYITFAFIGGIVGIVAGVPLSKFIIRKMCKNYISTNPYSVQIIAVLVSVAFVLIIIGFAAIMMRRIKKISVIETIHGSEEGERFGKLTRITLYKSKKLKVPEFLAIGNIINSFGKYIFLIISYTLAAMVLLTVFNIKSSLYSADYAKNFFQLNYDFHIYMNDEFAEYYYQKGGDYEGAMKLAVEDFNISGVPVKMRYMTGTEAEILKDDEDTIALTLMFGDTYNEGIPLRKGGKLPVRENEIILSYYTAKNEGIKLGDTLTLELDEYDDDKIGSHKVQRDFIVTGFFDIMEGGEAGAITGKEYKGGVKNVTRVTDLWIDVPKSEKAAYVQKLKDIYGDEVIKTLKEASIDDFSYITASIDMLKIIFSILIAFVLLLNTTLYMTVDLARETSGIAMLKCVGFSNSDVRKWQMIRMLIILVMAFLLGLLLENTVVNWFAERAFGIFGVTRFHFVPNPWEAYLLVPGIIFMIGLVAMRLCLIKVKGINIWNIRED